MNKLEKIRFLTSLTLQEIKQLTNREFYTKITGLMVKGVLTKTQHDWLDSQRKPVDSKTKEILDIFSGEII